MVRKREETLQNAVQMHKIKLYAIKLQDHGGIGGRKLWQKQFASAGDRHFFGEVRESIKLNRNEM